MEQKLWLNIGVLRPSGSQVFSVVRGNTSIALLSFRVGCSYSSLFYVGRGARQSIPVWDSIKVALSEFERVLLCVGLMVLELYNRTISRFELLAGPLGVANFKGEYGVR